MFVIHFSKLPLFKLVDHLTQQVVAPLSLSHHPDCSATSLDLQAFRQQWQQLQQLTPNDPNQSMPSSAESIDALQVDWLIDLFNTLFSAQNVRLVRGESEPEYFPATETAAARIEFAHGFFQSALHEISHWSLAGKHRRTLPDFGYWYAPDGRTEDQQQAFEQVEIKPQAIECLLSLMCGRNFRVSQDNLHADFDTSQSTFEKDVYNQAKLYIDTPQNLPTDAKTLLTVLAFVCHDTIGT